MKKNLFFLVSALILALGMTSCCETIHEYPDEGRAAVSLTMNVRNLAPEIYTVVDYTIDNANPGIFGIDEWRSLESRAFDAPQFERYYLGENKIASNEWNLRLVWEIYYGTNEEVRIGRGDLIERKVQLIDAAIELPSYTTEIDLPAGTYTLLAWADYVPVGTEDDHFYDTQNMSAIKSDLVLREDCQDNDLRDCFARTYEFRIENVKYLGEPRHYETTLTRPQGRYVVLATDYKDYLDLSNVPVEQNSVDCFYPTFLNVGYSIPEARPNLSASQIGYKFTPMRYIFDEKEMVSLGDDYSFVNGKESHLILNLTVTNPQGNEISKNENIDIPIYPDKLTIVLGRFLANSGNSGGLGIDDRFENEIVIKFKRRNNNN
ncbi:MAG: hypothetical protein E7079_03475 [Bacteroidales bacterium]|nr:hypothetical protein [Bacteroidales bacterium]